MNNLTDHILSTLNPAQLTNGGMTAYYVPSKFDRPKRKHRQISLTVHAFFFLKFQERISKRRLLQTQIYHHLDRLRILQTRLHRQYKVRHDDKAKQQKIQHENEKCVCKRIGKLIFVYFLVVLKIRYRIDGIVFSEAARECRRKKKEYIRCLETRVSALESQNKALIEELRQLKELYCQREETNTKSSNSNTTGVNKR